MKLIEVVVNTNTFYIKGETLPSAVGKAVSLYMALDEMDGRGEELIYRIHAHDRGPLHE